MTTCIALLRAINLGGQNKVAMSGLRAFFQELGFDDVRSLLQTGNIVFRGDARRGAALERLLEVEAEKRLGLRTVFIVRSAEEWRRVIAGNPFPDAAESDPAHLVVMCLKDTPDANAVTALRAAIKGPENIRAGGSQLYVVYPEGIGRSRLTMDLIERKLGTRGTGRNWNTVLKLAELVAA